MYNKIVTVVLVSILAACAAPRPQPATRPDAAQTGTRLRALPVPGEYGIDSSTSEVRLLVYRAGPLARLGHNHVMVNRAVTGQAQIGDALSTTSFSATLPVNAFTVDDAQSRAEEGEDFPGDIAEEAKAGTRRNMLSAAVLNAAEFPEVTVRSIALSGSLDAATAELEVAAAGHRSTISVPLTLQGDGHRIIASGSMELKQTELGLVPYSLMGGALQVQDAMRLKFQITLLTN